jgi:hypothetical protein
MQNFSVQSQLKVVQGIISELKKEEKIQAPKKEENV